MASYLPPTETLPIFDNMVFETNNTTALTYATAKNLFVTFPSAQGSSTITDFIAGTINYLSPSSGSFFNIGTNQVSGGTIRVGPTGVSGVSVHAGNIDCTNNQINNATDAALNNLTIGNLQTDGILNIGTGVRTTTGAINIGTGAGANVNPINIGGAGSAITLNGRVNTSLGPIAGLVSFELKTGASTINYTIVSTAINREYYLVVFPSGGISATITLPAPSTRTDQIIHIRSLATVNITITTPSGSIYPCVTSGNAFSPSWTAFTSNLAQTFFSNGTHWYGFN